MILGATSGPDYNGGSDLKIKLILIKPISAYFFRKFIKNKEPK